MTETELKSIVDNAVSRLLAEESQLLISDASELSISSTLKLFLQPQLADWSVDAEYNRVGAGQDPKRVLIEGEKKLRRPDIIIHHRTLKENLLAMEIKKTSNVEPTSKDLATLKGFKGDPDYRYQYAYFIRFRVGPNPGIHEEHWLS